MYRCLVLALLLTLAVPAFAHAYTWVEEGDEEVAKNDSGDYLTDDLKIGPDLDSDGVAWAVWYIDPWICSVSIVDSIKVDVFSSGDDYQVLLFNYTLNRYVNLGTYTGGTDAMIYNVDPADYFDPGGTSGMAIQVRTQGSDVAIVEDIEVNYSC